VLYKHTRGAPIVLVLDNLSVHRTRKVVDFSKRCKIEIVYNASYSSEFNPIERLWAFAKRNFRRRMICFDRFSH
jgi:transposase